VSDPRLELIAAASHFYHQGWMVGTAGNLSARCPDGSFWITASGCAKGKLTLDDFVHIESPQNLVVIAAGPQRRPSAETSIHGAIYSCFPQAQACYHVHSVAAMVAGHQTQGGDLPLPPLEMLKGFGLWLENPQVAMPVFENYLEVPKIGQEIIDRFQATPPPIPALLIRNHGVTVWANSPQEAFHRVEIAEFMFAYLAAMR
jgi:methylthioribulose-1-phosphate dehydratase